MSIDVMGTGVAVYPIAADQTGFWQLSGEAGPWRSAPVPSDSMPFVEVNLLLDSAAVRHGGQLPVIVHQTSDMAQPGLLTCNFVAVYNVAALVRDEWPDALPIDVDSILAVHGAPVPHASDEPPAQVRDLDVALHALRHLAFLRIHDAGVRRDLPMIVRSKLADVAPALFTMYQGPADILELTPTADVRNAA